VRTYPAAVLLRRRATAAGAPRVPDAGLGLRDRLHDEVMPPVVTEVVHVHHPVLDLARDLGEGNRGLVVALGHVVVLRRVPELPADSLELVVMTVEPPEDGLKCLVDQVKPHVTGQLEPSPDRRFRPVEAYLHAMYCLSGSIGNFRQVPLRDPSAADVRLGFQDFP
jgi:hypothetical protein